MLWALKTIWIGICIIAIIAGLSAAGYLIWSMVPSVTYLIVLLFALFFIGLTGRAVLDDFE